MSVGGFSRITIAGRGWFAPRTIPVSAIAAAQEVSRPSPLSCVVARGALDRAGFADPYGAWVQATHPMLGPVGGVVTDRRADLTGRYLVLTVTSFHILLQQRITPILYRMLQAHAGALMLRAFRDTNTDDPMLIKFIQADESGPLLEPQFRGQNLLQLADDLAQQSGQEYDVEIAEDGAISFVWRERVGEEKQVLLRDGYQVAGGTIDGSIMGLVNDLTGIADDRQYEEAEQHRATVNASIARRGRWQATRRYVGAVNESVIRPLVKQDLTSLAQDTILPVVTLPGRHPVLRHIRKGDTVRLDSAMHNGRVRFRVMVIAVDASNIVTLSGTAEAA